MTITLDVNGQLTEFPDIETANRFFAQEAAQASPAPTENPVPDWAQTQRDELRAVPSEPGAFVQNVFGYGEADTLGEGAGRMIQATGAGAGRGVEGLVNLPNSLGQGAEWVADRTLLPAMAAAGIVDPANVDAIKSDNSANMRVNLPGAVTDFEPQNRAERFAGAVGEFLPGAIALGPAGVARNALQYGALPAIASEAAGQATEGTAVEPYARFGAAVMAPALLARRAPTTSAASPMRPDPARVESANYIQQRGITPTAGQATGSDTLRRLEGAASPASQQLDDFTSAAMRSIGSDAPRATPEALRTAQTAIVQRMDDAVSGLSIRPTAAMGQSADDIARMYVERVPAGQLTPRIRGIATEIAEQATAPNATPISLASLRTWRSDIGRLTTSPDAATREAAHALRTLIDDASDAALKAAGREADIAALSAARVDYRNFLAVRDASTRAGAEAGSLSPTQLNQSVIRTQGRNAYGVGNTTDLGNLTRASAEILRPLATVSPGGVRAIEGASGAALGLMGYGAAGGGPAGLAAAAAGLVAPAVGRRVINSNVVQNALTNPLGSVGSLNALSSGVAANLGRD